MAAATFTGCIAIGQALGKIESCDWLVFSFCDLIGLSGQRRTNVHLNAVKMGQLMKPSVHRNISVSFNITKNIYIHFVSHKKMGIWVDLQAYPSWVMKHLITQ